MDDGNYYEHDSEEEEEDLEVEDLEEDTAYFDVSDFVNDDDTFENTGEESDDNASIASTDSKKEQEELDPDEIAEKVKTLEEVFSCLPPVLIKRILCREDVNGDIDKASDKLQEFQDMENPFDIFKTPPEGKPPTAWKPKGRVDDSEASRSGNQAGDRSGEEKRSRGAEQKNFRGRKQRRSVGNENEMHRDQGEAKEEHDWRRHSFDNNMVEQRGGYQGPRGQISRGARGRSRGGPRGGHRGGPAQGQGYPQGYRDANMGMPMPVPLMYQQWGFGGDNTFQPLGGHGNRGGRGQQPKPKPKSKNRNRGYRGKARGGNFQGQGEYQTGFQEEQVQFSYDQSQFTQRQHYAERGRGQQNQGKRQPRGRNAPPVRLSDLACGTSILGEYQPPGVFQEEDQLSYDQSQFTQRQQNPDRGRGQQNQGKRQPRGRNAPPVRLSDLACGTSILGEYPSPGGFKEEDQFSYDQSQFIQRQNYPDRGKGQQNQGRREPRGRNTRPVSLSDLASGNTEARRVSDDSDLGRFRGDDSNRRDQANRGRPRDSSRNRGRGQRGIRHAQSLSSVVDFDQNSGIGENTEEQFQFEPNKLRVRGLSETTTEDALTNFIEAMSGEEVKEVLKLRNGNAIVTMANDITDFSKIKTKGEKRGLDSAKVSIEQVPVCTSIVVTGLSDNTTRDAIELHFESQRNNGGPVKNVQFVPGSGRAVVVFEDPKDMEKVLARQEEKPHTLNQTQLSIRVYHEFLEGEDDDVPDDDSGGLEANSGDAPQKTQVSPQSEDKAQQLHIAVDPDVMEFVTSTAFHGQLCNALAVKKSEITWKPDNKMAVIVYRGDDSTDSWQAECIDEVQNFLGKFTKCDVQVNKDFWKAVVSQLASVRACLGVDPPLVKAIEDSCVARIVSLSTNVEDYEGKLKAKLEEIYKEETRKTYLKKKVPNVAEERLILLKKIKFVEKLQEKNKELEIKLDTEAEEIYFEGPQPQFTEATMKFYKQISDMIEKKLTFSNSILEVLGSDKGLQKVKLELESNNVEAVFVIDREARIIGTSGAHADNAVRHVNKLMLEEKVQVDDKSKYLLKTTEWRKLCDEINNETDVRVHRNNWNDTYVAGFRDEVVEVMKKLNSFLETNCIKEERFLCASPNIRRYLEELRQEDLRSIENQLKDFQVKIKKGKGDADFEISGNKEGLTRVRKKLDALIKNTETKTFEVKQPGLRKYFESEKGDRLVKSVEKDQNCAIQVQKNFGQLHTQATAEDSGSSDQDDRDVSDDDDDDDDEEEVVTGADASVLVLNHGHKISWRAGTIETEKADVLVCSQGASSQAIVNAGVPTGANPNVGDITVSPGLPLASHVILTNCSQWHSGKGEAILRAIVKKCLQKGEELGASSIAFPVIGAGKLHFPADAASRIMLEETINFCQANAGSNVQDIRFVVYQQDHALTAAFQQEMGKLQAKHKSRPLMGRLLRSIRSKFRPRAAGSTGRVTIEVLQGDLCKETTNAIVNVNSKDMNMESAGALGKAVKQASGPQVVAECTQLGQQSGGTAVITSGGNLHARHIIHLIPDSAQKDHLQQCVERCLRLAETRGLQSISIPAVGTGAFGLSAVDSASLIFKALGNFSASFNTVRRVRIVVFQPQMLQAFQVEHQRHSSHSDQGISSGVGQGLCFSVEVKNGDLTQENTDAIMNIISTDMNMANAGELSKAVARVSGAQVQQECSQLGQQTAGSAVMTSGGALPNARHIIHIIPGSSDKQHLQQCLEEGLRVADANNLRSISIPSVGTGGYGMAATDSAQLTFQALRNFSGNCKSIRKVRVVVFQAQMLQDFVQEQRRQLTQDVPYAALEEDEESDGSSSDEGDARATRPSQRASHEHSVKICVIGKSKASVEKAVESLKKGFSEACTTQKVENEIISHLSQKQINSLRRKAADGDVKLEVEAVVNRIVVRGQPTEVSSMVGEVWKEISERTRKKQEEEQALLVSKNIEWSYEIQGNKMYFSPKTNAKIEMAHSKDEPRVQVSLRADQFVIDLKAKTGRGQRTGEQILLTRKVKGAEEGIALPQHWTPMPGPDMTVHLVPLSQTSSEYQNVVRQFQVTSPGVNIQKIERVQNPHLYKSYMVRKQKMDKDTGGNSEKLLFHGTAAKNITHINTQGFNRSFCGANGVAFGRGVYFARDSSYSVRYAQGGPGGRFMYLARVLVGKYCVGNSSMIVPPPKHASRPEILYESVVDNLGNPSIYVVFFDNQCYPEYLITLQ